ncbi:MAG: PQQ-binding-like beta-propeller repeat protein [Planctomycetia bacterium]|nr:PQQ-binding-like beta-propeller repeat protein [Planctomycetia bacterium]
MRPLPARNEDSENADSGAVPNRLACYDIRTGKLVWQLEEDTLTAQGLMFLGSPLCIGETLYVIGERNGLVQLFALEKNSGKILWLQTLSLALPQGIREAIACTPQMCEGVLLCPTPNGVLVGVDSVTHTLRWGNVFISPDMMDSRHAYFEPSLASRIQGNLIYDNLDNREIIVRGERAYFFTYKTSSLVCMNGTTGEILWNVQPAYGYIATVDDKYVYVKTPQGFKIFQVEDGKELMSRLFMVGNLPTSGLGFMAGKDYFLSQNGNRVTRYSLADYEEPEKENPARGLPREIATRHDSGTLGNLVPAGDFILSHNGVMLEAFVQKNAAPEYIKTLREKDADSPEALMVEATMFWDKGQLADAITLLEKGRPYTDELLKRAGLEFLKQSTKQKNVPTLKNKSTPENTAEQKMDIAEIDAELIKIYGWMETDEEKARFCQLAIQEMEKAERWEEALNWSQKLWEIVKITEKEILLEAEIISQEKIEEIEKAGNTEEDVNWLNREKLWTRLKNSPMWQSPSVWIGCTLQRLMEKMPSESPVRAKIAQWAETEYAALQEEMLHFLNTESGTSKNPENPKLTDNSESTLADKSEKTENKSAEKTVKKVGKTGFSESMEESVIGNRNASENAEKLQKKYVAFRTQFAVWDGMPKVEEDYLKLVKFTRNFTALEAYWFQKEPSRAKVAATLTKTYLELGDLKRAALYVRWLERKFPKETLLDGKTATAWRLELPKNHEIRKIIDPEMMEFPQGKITVTKKDEDRNGSELPFHGMLSLLGKHQENCTPLVDTQLITESGLTTTVMCKDTLGRVLFYFPASKIGNQSGIMFRGIENNSELIYSGTLFGTTVGYLSMDKIYSYIPKITWDTNKMGEVPEYAWVYQAQKLPIKTYLEPYLRSIEENILAESLQVMEENPFGFKEYNADGECTPSGVITPYTDDTNHIVNMESGTLLWKCKPPFSGLLPIWKDGKLEGIVTCMVPDEPDTQLSSDYDHYALEKSAETENAVETENTSETRATEETEKEEVANAPNTEKPSVRNSEVVIYDKTIEELVQILEKEYGVTRNEIWGLYPEPVPVQHPTSGEFIKLISMPRGSAFYHRGGLALYQFNKWLVCYDPSKEKVIWCRSGYIYSMTEERTDSISLDREWVYYLTPDRKLEMIQITTGKLLQLQFPEPKLSESEEKKGKWTPEDVTDIGILPDENGCFTAILGHSVVYEPKEKLLDEKRDKKVNDTNGDKNAENGNGKNTESNENNEEENSQIFVSPVNGSDLEVLRLKYALICRFDADGKALWEHSRFQQEETFLLGNLPPHIPVLGMAHEEESSDNRSSENALVLKFLDRRNGRVIYNARLPMNILLRMVGNPIEKRAELTLMSTSQIVFDFSDEPYGEKEISGVDRRAALMNEIQRREQKIEDSKRYILGQEKSIAQEKKNFEQRNANNTDQEAKEEAAEFFSKRVTQLEKELDTHRDFVREETEKVNALKKELDAENALRGGPLETEKDTRNKTEKKNENETGTPNVTNLKSENNEKTESSKLMEEEKLEVKE